MEKFYDELRKSTFLRNIIKYWDIDELKTLNEENLKQYFDYLNKEKEEEKINLREVLIINLNNISDSEINILLEKMNQLSQTYYMLLVLLLIIDSNQKLEINPDKYDDIEPRFFLSPNIQKNQKDWKKQFFLYY